MRRLLVLSMLLVAASLLPPAQRSNAGLAACLLNARDTKVAFPGVNYIAYASASCVGEDFQSAQLDLTIDYYDWNEQRWIAQSFFAKQTAENDDFIIAFNFTNVPPYLGVNCRRIQSTFRFIHSGRGQLFTLKSNGECY